MTAPLGPQSTANAGEHTFGATSRRIGHLAAAACNLALLWVSHRLLDWGWPAFLTDDFVHVLGILTASLVANILADVGLAIHDGRRLTLVTELIRTWFGLAVAVRLLEVFPFDFRGYATDWSGGLRGLLILVVAATGIAMVVDLVQLVAGSREA